jgi:hypothetical protein
MPACTRQAIGTVRPVAARPLKRVYGNTGWDGQAFGDYQLQCDPRYTFYRGSVTDPVPAAQIDHFEWQLTSATDTSRGFTVEATR